MASFTGMIYMYYVAAIFTTMPTTQYVWINQTATFTCATNVTGYTLSFSIPGVSFEPTGDGHLMITVTFTVTSDNNGTSVRCLADDGVDFKVIHLGFAYAQGNHRECGSTTLC